MRSNYERQAFSPLQRVKKRKNNKEMICRMQQRCTWMLLDACCKKRTMKWPSNMPNDASAWREGKYVQINKAQEEEEQGVEEEEEEQRDNVR